MQSNHLKEHVLEILRCEGNFSATCIGYAIVT